MNKDANTPEAAPAAEAPAAAKNTTSAPKSLAQTKSGAKTATKSKAKTETKAKAEAEAESTNEIPMDAAAIKAYSSVIADAAEDSEPSKPVIYTKTIPDEPKQAAQPLDSDPMASMIRNEISSIKDASVKAAKEKADE